MKQKKKKRISARFKVGNRVRFTLGKNNSLSGVIVEDQGKIAPNGGNFYRVRIEPETFILVSSNDLRELQKL